MEPALGSTSCPPWPMVVNRGIGAPVAPVLGPEPGDSVPALAPRPSPERSLEKAAKLCYPTLPATGSSTRQTGAALLNSYRFAYIL